MFGLYYSAAEGYTVRRGGNRGEVVYGPTSNETAARAVKEWVGKVGYRGGRLVRCEDGALYTWVHQGLFDSQGRIATVTRPGHSRNVQTCVCYSDGQTKVEESLTTEHDTYEEALEVALEWVGGG